MSRDVISCWVTDSCKLLPCRKSNAPKTRVFGVLQPLPCDFRSNGIISSPWSHVTSFSVTWRLLRATALQEVKHTKTSSFRPSTATSRWLPVKWRLFWVTSGRVRSRDVISCHIKPSSCELQHCRKPNAPNIQLFGLLSHFHMTSSQMTSLQVTSGHVRSHDVVCGHMMLRFACYSLLGSQMYRTPDFSAFYSHFGQIISLPGYFRLREVAWCHFRSLDGLLLRATALEKVKSKKKSSFGPSTATSRWLSANDNFRVTSGHVRLHDVISSHMTAFSCELQPCRK